MSCTLINDFLLNTKTVCLSDESTGYLLGKHDTSSPTSSLQYSTVYRIYKFTSVLSYKSGEIVAKYETILYL